MVTKSRAQILREQRKKRGRVHPVPEYLTKEEIEYLKLRYSPETLRKYGISSRENVPYRRGHRLLARARHMGGCCEVDSRYLRRNRVGKNKRLRGGGNPYKPPKPPEEPPVGQG